MALTSEEVVPFAAFGPEKEDWKREGNFFTGEELREMETAWEVIIEQPQALILSAD
jgi:hypothetical protein